jgi:putative intracellular protease/amidase
MDNSCSRRLNPRIVAIAAINVLILASRAAQAGNTETVAPRIHVAIYADDGASKNGSPQLKRSLPKELGYDVDLISAEEIRGGALDRFDVVIHPGGSGSKQGNTLGPEGRRKVCDFVAGGGGFVGVCAGAYLASAHYPWSLGILDANVIDREHWARGSGNVELQVEPCGREMFALSEERIEIYYHQGPLLGPAQNNSIPDYQTVAIYETEIAENGAPKGVMTGTTAVARGRFGAGRVLCFSPHPEKTPGRENLVRIAVRWVAGDNATPSGAGD